MPNEPDKKPDDILSATKAYRRAVARAASAEAKYLAAKAAVVEAIKAVDAAVKAAT